MLKKIGPWIGGVKRYVSNIQEEVSILDKESFDTDINNNTQSEKKDTNDQGTK